VTDEPARLAHPEEPGIANAAVISARMIASKALSPGAVAKWTTASRG
jgi:hypothetical protein